MNVLLAGTLPLFLFAAAASTGGSASVPTTRNACRATLTVADARVLAVQTPNARAFAENQSAVLKTELAGTSGGTVHVRVIDTAHRNEVIGVYAVNLHTGSILDDDQEPAEDDVTAAARQRLIARHCAAR